MQVEGDAPGGVVRHHGLVHVDRPLGCARRPAGEVEQGHVGGVGRGNLVDGIGLLEQGGQIEGVRRERRSARRIVTGGDQHVEQIRQVGSDLGHLAAVQRLGGDQDTPPTQVKALSDGRGPEGGEQRAQDAAVLQGSDDRHIEVRHAGEQHVDPGPGGHTQPVEGVREPARALGQLAVGQVAALPLAIHASQGDMVAAGPGRVAVHRLVGDVEPTAVREPVERLARPIPGERGALGVVVGHVGGGIARGRTLVDRLPRHRSPLAHDMSNAPDRSSPGTIDATRSGPGAPRVEGHLRPPGPPGTSPAGTAPGPATSCLGQPGDLRPWAAATRAPDDGAVRLDGPT